MHNDTPVIAPSTVDRVATLVPLLAIVAILAALVAPRMTPGLLFLLTGPTIAVAALAVGRLEMPRPFPGLAWGFAAFGVYLAINALWSVDRGAAFGKVALYGLNVALVMLAATGIPRLPPETAKRLAHAILIGVAIGAVFLLVEVLFGQPIRRFAGSLLPFLRPPSKHSTVANGWITHIGLYTVNRNLAVLNLMLWPALLLLRSWVEPGRARLLAGLALLVAAVAMFRSEHETSMLALVAGCLVFAAMSFAAPMTRRLVLAGWVAATLLIVPLAAYSYAGGLHQASWLPQTARNRIVLWGFTAEKVRAAPLLGVGVDSTKPLDEDAAPTAVKAPGEAYPQRTGRHSHNIFMQTWYELGAIGAALLLAIGLLLQGALARLPASVQPYAYASFVATSVIGAFSWGMWQPWFMASFGIWAILLLVAVDAERRAGSQS